LPTLSCKLVAQLRTQASPAPDHLDSGGEVKSDVPGAGDNTAFIRIPHDFRTWANNGISCQLRKFGIVRGAQGRRTPKQVRLDQLEGLSGRTARLLVRIPVAPAPTQEDIRDQQ
jgi:hypothetical protein